MCDNMHKDEYVIKAVSKIKNANAKNEVSTELELHIADRIQYYKEIGYDEETAAQKAVEHMGDPEAVSNAFCEIYPTVSVSTAVFATILVVAVVFLFNLVTFFTVDDGKMGYGISEFLTLCCFIGLSNYGKNRYSRYICILPIFAYFLTFFHYAWLVAYLKGDFHLCSRIILAFFCLITGDLNGLASFPNVGGITVAPWLTYITCIFYGLILFVLLASFISACKLRSPQYGLFHKRMGRRITFLQKCILCFSAIAVCISVPVSLIGHVFVKNPVESLTNYEANPHFDYIMIVQSDTPCSFDDTNMDDVLLFRSDYDWSVYIFWNMIGESDTIIFDNIQDGVYNVFQEEVSVPCGNLMKCTVRKETLQCQLNKKYAYIGFIKDRGTYIDENNLSAFVTITEDDWQETASVGTVCAAVDQYNCVEIIIKEAEA